MKIKRIKARAIILAICIFISMFYSNVSLYAGSYEEMYVVVKKTYVSGGDFYERKYKYFNNGLIKNLHIKSVGYDDNDKDEDYSYVIKKGRVYEETIGDSTYRYSYDSKGRKNKKLSLNEEGKIGNTSTWKYDKSNRITENKLMYDKKLGYIWKYKYKYNAKKKELKTVRTQIFKSKRESTKQKVMYVSKMDDYGNVINKKGESQNGGNYNAKFELTYDKNKNVNKVDCISNRKLKQGGDIYSGRIIIKYYYKKVKVPKNLKTKVEDQQMEIKKYENVVY